MELEQLPVPCEDTIKGRLKIAMPLLAVSCLPVGYILAKHRCVRESRSRPHIDIRFPPIHFLAFWVKRLQKSPMFALLREIVANVSDLRCSPSDRSFHRIRRQLENARLALLSTS